MEDFVLDITSYQMGRVWLYNVSQRAEQYQSLLLSDSAILYRIPHSFYIIIIQQATIEANNVTYIIFCSLLSSPLNKLARCNALLKA